MTSQRPYRQKIPAADLERVVARIAAGEPKASIARSYGAHPSSIDGFLKRHGVAKSRSHHNQLFDDAQEAEILALRRAGEPISNLAFRFGTSENTMRKVLLRAERRGSASEVAPPVPNNVVPLRSRAGKTPPTRRIEPARAEREIRRLVWEVTQKVEIVDSFRSQHGRALAEALAGSAEREIAVRELVRCADVLRTVADEIGRAPEQESHRYGSATR